MTDEYREKRIAEIIDQIAEGHGRLSDQYRDDPVLPEALIRILSDENSDSGLLNDALQCTYNLGKPAIRPLVLALENRRMYPGGEGLTRYLFRALTDPSQADDVVAVVIDELVLRQSGRPEEHFSSAVVAQVLEKAIEYNPRLHRRILSDLCTLAYEHDDGVRDRAVALARRLGADEFASLA